MHGAGGAGRQTADPGGGPLPARPRRHVQEGGPRRPQPVPLRASRRPGHPPLPPGGPVQGRNSSTAFLVGLSGRVPLIRIRIQHFRLNTDPDPGGFNDH
jgi:hypothetical protein